jgi:hypothetical protein
MRAYCPACAVEVEYEGQGTNAHCSVCGRTRGAADLFLASRARAARDAKLKWVWIAAGGVAFMALLFLRPDQTLATLISTTVQVAGLALVLWVCKRLVDIFRGGK